MFDEIFEWDESKNKNNFLKHGIVLRRCNVKECYDFSKGFRKPQLAESLKKNGYKVEITDSKSSDRRVVDEYYVTPEEVMAYDARRSSNKVHN
jgi:N-acetyl-anhydromuramyl-L-alanine amidase AmpD